MDREQAPLTLLLLLLGALMLILSSCSDDDKKKLGEVCAAHSECESGLCTTDEKSPPLGDGSAPTVKRCQAPSL